MSYNPISIDDEDVGNDFTSGLQSRSRNDINDIKNNNYDVNSISNI